ncbi:glycosyltransferase [uncultured Flavobacterium sp.]|uniref:glycosyltransferase n=1 Tax=uncultured Flavobacterium sp. TaxID=165435 RepID=UPI00292F51A1|nr:glycosyltransferase [uncultured Flavobacterium sp.]
MVIAGKAWKNDLSEYTQIIKELEIEDIVITDFRYIPDDEVSFFYQKADLVVLPYRDIYQSGVLLLTMSYGKPIICSDLKPFKEVITHNKNGFLFESQNPIDLAIRIQEVIANKTRLTDITDNANAIICKNYDWFKIGIATKNFYKLIYSIDS